MRSRENLEKLFNFLKFITYVIPSIAILVSSKANKLGILGILILILFFNTYFRSFYIHKRLNNLLYRKLSILLDFVIVLAITYISTSNLSLLFYMVLITESTLTCSVVFGAGMCLTTSIAIFILDGSLTGFDNIPKLFTDTFTSIFISSSFTFVMSYLGKTQLLEREKIARVNQELEQAYKKLLDNASKVQELSIEKERTRMAGEIHDTLAHTLTAVIVQLEACKKLIDIDPQRSKLEMEKAQEVTRSGLNDVKRTIKALRPQILENNSFFGAITIMIEDMKHNANIDFEFNWNVPDDFKMPQSMEVALFRVIQESITNSLRHGAAKKIIIKVGYKNCMLKVDIEDDGTGCNHIKKGFGLQGITERIEGLKGVVNFSSVPGKSFLTNVSVPCRGGIIIGN